MIGNDPDTKNDNTMARFKNTNINLLSDIRKTYRKTYPEDEVGKELAEGNTFAELLAVLINQSESAYSFLFANRHYCDSLVRERIFEMLSVITKIPYSKISDLWLYGKTSLIKTA